MSDIATKLAELKQLRNDIRAAIENKGANLPIGSPMANYATAIEAISSGGEPIVGATSMANMFRNSVATTLDLRLLDTSKVITMASMFYNSSATALDVSSFDTSKVTTMASMFRDSSATTGCARTQADADKFNASSNKPAALTFIVKP